MIDSLQLSELFSFIVFKISETGILKPFLKNLFCTPYDIENQ